MARAVKMKTKQIILVVIALLFCATLLAQSDASPVKATPITPGKILHDSGGWGYAIILTFIIGLVYGIVRYIQLYQREKIDAQKFYLKLKGYLKNDQLDEAAKVAESFKGTTLGYIFWSGIRIYIDTRKANKKGEELDRAVQNGFEEAVLQTVFKIDANLSWFNTLAQICTYLGLLGTIWGLLEAFESLANAPESQKNQLLTAGISKAIGTTAMGLVAAIPLTLIHGGLYGRAQKILADIDEHTVKIINYLSYVNRG